MSKGDNRHKIMSGFDASASLEIARDGARGTPGKGFVINLDLAPYAPREFRGQQRTNCLFLRYSEKKDCLELHNGSRRGRYPNGRDRIPVNLAVAIGIDFPRWTKPSCGVRQPGRSCIRDGSRTERVS